MERVAGLGRPVRAVPLYGHRVVVSEATSRSVCTSSSGRYQRVGSGRLEQRVAAVGSRPGPRRRARCGRGGRSARTSTRLRVSRAWTCTSSASSYQARPVSQAKVQCPATASMGGGGSSKRNAAPGTSGRPRRRGGCRGGGRRPPVDGRRQVELHVLGRDGVGGQHPGAVPGEQQGPAGVGDGHVVELHPDVAGAGLDEGLRGANTAASSDRRVRRACAASRRRRASCGTSGRPPARCRRSRSRRPGVQGDRGGVAADDPGHHRVEAVGGGEARRARSRSRRPTPRPWCAGVDVDRVLDGRRVGRAARGRATATRSRRPPRCRPRHHHRVGARRGPAASTTWSSSVRGTMSKVTVDPTHLAVVDRPDRLGVRQRSPAARSQRSERHATASPAGGSVRAGDTGGEASRRDSRRLSSMASSTSGASGSRRVGSRTVSSPARASRRAQEATSSSSVRKMTCGVPAVRRSSSSSAGLSGGGEPGERVVEDDREALAGGCRGCGPGPAGRPAPGRGRRPGRRRRSTAPDESWPRLWMSSRSRAGRGDLLVVLERPVDADVAGDLAPAGGRDAGGPRPRRAGGARFSWLDTRPLTRCELEAEVGLRRRPRRAPRARRRRPGRPGPGRRRRRRSRAGRWR